MILFFLFPFFLFLVYMFYLVFVWQWGKNCQPFYNNGTPLIIGHRGSPGLITENTLPSFSHAIGQGVDGLELDIRLSHDGQIIIFHDKDLKRLSERKEKIKNLSLAELQSIQLKKQPNQTEEIYIPSLNDLVPLLNQIKVLNIEIKSDGLFKDHDILEPLIKFLDKYKFDDKCIVSSFNPLILMKLRLNRPHTIIGFLYNRNKLFHSWDNMIWMLRVQPENLHIHYSLLNSWIINWARKKGMRINSYTINDKKVFNKANVDGVFTDNIEYLK
jgi:glycerophosphoryl diester phosphodiesterase